jgi:Uma2 family endonuclease
MTTALTSLTPSKPLPGEVISQDNVSWEQYEKLVEDPAYYHVRVTYDQGRMTLMSPLPIHDRVKTLTGRLIEFAAFELDIPISSFGSTTWKRRDLARGLEPDECYYVQSEPLVHGRSDIDLRRDPPPDLAVEIDITRNPLNRPSIYAALGVGELWRYDGKRFEFVRRNAGGSYEQIQTSAALPFMTAPIVDRFITLMLQNENAGLRAFRDWLRTPPK